MARSRPVNAQNRIDNFSQNQRNEQREKLALFYHTCINHGCDLVTLQFTSSSFKIHKRKKTTTTNY